MIAQFYQNTILKNPKLILIFLVIALFNFGYHSKDFKLDASSETLLIEGDPDLEYLKEITNRYGSKDFLILTYTPNEGMVSNVSINNLLSLKYKIQSLNWVHSVITLLDIPLLNNSDAPLQERLENFKTLKDEDIDKERGFNEILSSPVFRNFVISEDGKTSGIIVNIKNKKLPDLSKWKNITSKVLNPRKDVNIGIIGKYVNLKDAYKSLDEALIHGGISNNVKVNLKRIDSENIKPEKIKPLLKNVSGVLIPGGFGKRGSEGKIAAIKYARLNHIPFFGICFGMQMAIIEAARNLLNIKNASTSEFGNNCTPVVGLLEEWQKGKKIIKGSEKNLGGTMRLGLYDAVLKNNSLISKIYTAKKIKERHRHRYEVNIEYKDDFEKKV